MNAFRSLPAFCPPASVARGARSLRFALHLAMAAAPLAGLQAAPLSSESVRAYDIPAGSLDSAITRFAHESGVNIAFAAHQLDGLASPGLHGRFDATQALARLLAGSGLVAQAQPGGGFLLRRGDDQALALPDATVTAQRESAWGPVQGYSAKRSATGTKTDAALLDTPQSISVVGRQQLDRQNVQSVRQALRYVPGVLPEYRGTGGSRYDTILYRGFGGGVNYDYGYLDGMRLLGSNYAVPQVDPYLLERVEVLRGPSSVLYGQATPGGMVNLVSKRPSTDAAHEVELQVGSHDRYQLGLDSTGALDDEGRLAYRVIALKRTADSQVDHSREERLALAPSLTWQPDEDTRLTLQALYQDDPDGGYYGFLPYQGTVKPLASGRLSTHFFDGDADFDRFRRTQQSLGYLFEHRFDEVWSVRQNFRYMHMDTDYRSVFTAGVNTAQQLLTRRVMFDEDQLDAYTLDNQLQADFATGALRHTALLGVDYQHLSSREQQGLASAPSLSVTAPDYHQGIGKPAETLRTRQVQEQTGLYLQDQMHLGNWSLLLGGREDVASTDTDDRRNDQSTHQGDRAFTWRSGLVYQFDSGLAPYVSYSRSFQPTAGTDYQGGAFQPSKGEQYEAGVKYQPPKQNGFVTLAVYQLTQQNVLTSDADHPNFSTQTGEARSRGVELEGHLEPTRSLSLIGAYTYLDNEVTHSNDGNEGKRITYIPQHMASLWADYSFHGGALDRFGVNAGVRYIGTSYADALNTLKVPAYTLLDVGAHYDLAALDPSLAGWQVETTVNNLADKEYVSACATATKCFWGGRRSVLASVKYSW
ncbi:iron complex outermembrane recepter protein [Pseudomonas citronellolis]|uniref:Metal-pseudopaline receptor CntO n=1 Tax=Pseudomonas citronellolis TaxID=53408 RepID=A0AAQ1KJK6_9PSED|nr:TonB-dependent siderophore receptor [Pseudomonas citronellolis]TGC26376.1 TonB-dependent siderophore receptor [Pseudomonas citronellolis]SFD56152.1 iron complex outermembrane recepter protein [Pseudomonas citronellolis]